MQERAPRLIKVLRDPAPGKGDTPVFHAGPIRLSPDRLKREIQGDGWGRGKVHQLEAVGHRSSLALPSSKQLTFDFWNAPGVF